MFISKKISVLIAIINMLFVLCACTNEERVGSVEISPPNQSVVELATTVYKAEELNNIVRFAGSVTELNEQYPIECFRRDGEIYRAAFLGEDCIAILLFDRDGSRFLSGIYSMNRLKQDFDNIQKGCGLDKVQEIDLHGNYYFLQTGRNDVPRRSSHYTKDGYLITIEYDTSNTVVEVHRELI